MSNIMIFYGSKEKFNEKLPDDYENLTEIVYETDKDSKQFTLVVPTNNEENIEEKEKKRFVENLVVSSDEYAGVREHVIINFANFLAKLDVRNIYLQNPPIHISQQVQRLYEHVDVQHQKYTSISIEHLKDIKKNYTSTVIGQENVRTEIIQSLFPLTLTTREKPVVLMFYGKSGIGKTETAKYLADVVKESLFRKQFSMFQNNQFSTYLFGGAHYEKSFAKDLLDRESNILLLDEFDKAHPSFHSAFYQLFDEGIYEDQNYYLELKKSVIICTSNYQDLDEIEKELGSAIFNRFDKIIEFTDLSNDAKNEIGKRWFLELSTQYEEQYGKTLPQVIKERLESFYSECENARQIRHLIEDTFSHYLVSGIE
ncbi:AAA family ATPase [Enterococcus sp. AZ045]|uniref:AAA family ATPase n=1 Tax=Enterococcus sp. AZ045 TaxID=2774807 RepID=UPI003F68D2DF